jgi:hypothetical protein
MNKQITGFIAVDRVDGYCEFCTLAHTELWCGEKLMEHYTRRDKDSFDLRPVRLIFTDEPQILEYENCVQHEGLITALMETNEWQARRIVELEAERDAEQEQMILELRAALSKTDIYVSKDEWAKFEKAVRGES